MYICKGLFPLVPKGISHFLVVGASLCVTVSRSCLINLFTINLLKGSHYLYTYAISFLLVTIFPKMGEWGCR